MSPHELSTAVQDGPELRSTANTAPEAHGLRVLHIITRMILGGAQENTLLTVEGLNRLGYEATLVSGVDHGPEGELLTLAAKRVPLIVVEELYRKINPLDDVIALFKLCRIIRKGRYHIVHTHSSKAGVIGRIAARLAGAPLVVHTIHGLSFHDFQPWILNRTCRLVERLCAPLTDHFISVAGITSRKAIAAGIGRAENHSKISSGMELDWFLDSHADPEAARRELGIPSGAPVVGKIARLFPLKGHEELLNAAPAIVERIPSVKFLLVGDGIWRDRLTEKARRLGVLGNVIFAGLVGRERIPHMISAMDVLVHTSLREGLARALPQALAMGKPCVSLDLDGAPEVVIPGMTGILVRPNDTVALSGAIIRLLEDADLRRQMGSNGRRVVDPAFRAETMVGKIAAVYQGLVSRHPERLAAWEWRISRRGSR
jgi:glycosyltransferase involved in cell wall biosynthesis